MNYTYNEILSRLAHSPTPLENAPSSPVNSGLKMRDHHHPWSITEPEFNLIMNRVVARNRKHGFEVATAFGISALAAGLGFQQTGGCMITIDAYIEEHYNYCGGYKEKHNETYQDMDGWKSVNYILKEFDLKDVVFPVVGWSPDDISKFVFERNIDYALIDGGHWNEQVIRDVKGIQPYLKDSFTLFLHDGHSVTPDVRAEISTILQAPIVQVASMPNSWDMLMVEK